MNTFFVNIYLLCWLQVARQSQTTYVIIMNGSDIEIDVHRLNDGGLLLCYDGNSHTTYMKEEVDRQDCHCVKSTLLIYLSDLIFAHLQPYSIPVVIASLLATRLVCLRKRGIPQC